MKKLIYLLLLPLCLFSCGDDDEGRVDPSTVPAPTVASCSIENGGTTLATTDSLVVTYDADVVYNPLSKVTISQGEVTSAEIKDKRRLVVGLSLKAGLTYTVIIPGDAVIGYASKKWAEEIQITFSTERGAAIADPSLVVKSLTNPNATAEAKKVYDAMLANYGKKQISGAMGEVAWNTTFCDMIKEASGKYPAIVGFDYIHLASSPANWIDYGDITPVKKIWDAGSVPAMTWHWNVPKSEGSNELDARSDQFKASNVLVEGTWENKVAEADVKKLAGYLKLLQDAGIPVLWRPFHEAAGDYVWGHWFWWGNSGVETTKQLWKWLHDKLTGEYGLNNLIWVWTVQTSAEGKLASLDQVRAAYPGDELADMVGADLYEDALSNQTPQFEMLYKLVGGKKMVALSECGNLLDVDSAFADGALWSYFMGWYEMNDAGQLGFHNWNTNGEWKTVLNNPLVINQGQLF